MEKKIREEKERGRNCEGLRGHFLGLKSERGGLLVFRWGDEVLVGILVNQGYSRGKQKTIRSMETLEKNIR